MSTKDSRIEAEPAGLTFEVSSLVGAQVAAIGELALALAKEVESFNLGSRLDLEDGIDLQSAVRTYEIHLIKSALSLTQGNQLRASRLLGLKATTLNAKIKRYDILTFAELQAFTQKLS